MNANLKYFVDVLLLISGLFFVFYLVYGRAKRKPLIGNYEPGKIGYEEFIKLVTNLKVLVVATAITMFFIFRVVIDAQDILHYSSVSILLIPVVLILLSFAMIIVVLSAIFKKR